ncbi:MAG: hypothetical protein AABM64_00945 [Pseudomonadota bacterium]
MHVLVEAQIHRKVGDIDEVAWLPRSIAGALLRKFPGAHDFGVEGDDVDAIETARNFVVVSGRVRVGRHEGKDERRGGRQGPGSRDLFEVRPEAEQLHFAKGLKLQKRLVAGHDGVRAAGNGTFQNPVIGLIGENRELAAGLDDDRQVGKKDRNVRQFFGIAREFPRKDAQQFIQNRLEKEKLVSFFDDPAKRDVRASARKNQRRHRNVGVEADFHCRR